ncbi:MAG: patatin-like phospholipase family protein [Ignavibacteriaceae bacterium]|jgi:patatin-like phospholipase/acyl hydrolase|nr:patatin-like phospholipase family protein [Ignavibacteriaceae bacterium]
MLANLEDDLNINIADHFDLIVGTSTGGIIAIGLSIGYRPSEILDFYVSNKRQIFNKNIFTDIKHLYKNKYSPDILEQSLKKYFKENRLADCKNRIVIPAYNMSDDEVYIFKTPHHERLRRDYKVPLWKVAMATSAAPTYFPSFNDIDNIRLIDGGVWANNPTLVGITEAISMLNINISDIKVLSLGTTTNLKDRSAKLNRGGLWQWKYDGVNLLMHCQSIGTFNTVTHILGKDNILRIDPVVPDGLFKLDKLNTSELIAKASSSSRKLMPKVKEKFFSHFAEKYVPLYK